MKSFDEIRRVLIAIEDSSYSDHAAKYGFGLARTLHAEVALLHVNEVPVTTPYVADPMLNEAPVMVPELISAQEEAGKRLLDRVAGTFGEGTIIHTFAKLGSPKDEILATAEEFGADLIILGTHGRSGFDLFISGSVSDKVVRKASCPVLVIPNKEAEE
jgi:nucleotide-binding universal stress UspA family protein